MLRRRFRIGHAAATIVLGLGLAACGSGSDANTPGVTDAPCPNAVNKDHGCIYLGVISDMSGPFRNLGPAFTTAEQAFWKRVNQQGGIGGHDVDVSTYVRDSQYDVNLHKKMFQELKGKVLALAQTLGSPTTAAILGDLKAAKMVAVPASYTSGWEFEDGILESGTSYCMEMMNGVDYAIGVFNVRKIMAVHYPGDYGDDAAAGAKIAASRHRLAFSHVVTKVGADEQGAAVDAILKARPDLVTLTTNPSDATVIMGKATARGFTGHFVGSNPTWNKQMLKDPAAPAIAKRYLETSAFKPFATDSPGHSAMREALGDVEPDDTYTAGWAWSYPLKAVLQKAAADKDLTRDGVLKALKQLTTVDYEGMLPPDAGDFSGNGDKVAFRKSVVAQPDDHELTGIKVIKDFFAGPTAASFILDKPCYLKL